jgi:light-regulated signal transduction histidine kinase (bacteriophytochrome)
MVEDEAGDAELVRHELNKAGFNFVFKRVESEPAFIEGLAGFRPTVILSDHGVAAFDGFAALSIAQSQCPEVPFIFVTGSLGEEMTAMALKKGASDFVLKHRISSLSPALHRALRETHLRLQRQKAEQEIRRLNEELEHRVAKRTADLEAANKELEAFSYSVSHELRAPLRQIEGFIDILRTTKGSILDQEANQYLATVARAAERLGRLIDDLLAFSRAARTGMRRRKVKLHEVCARTIEELGQDAAGRQVEWIIGPLPEVEADPALLHQVFLNLIGNALKYTNRREQARIEIGSRAGEEEHIIFVKDNGVGFDMRYAKKLFGVFQRLHSPSEFAGTGIGLANVRRIIHQHGGHTWAEGVQNQGATFYFSLPTST